MNSPFPSSNNNVQEGGRFLPDLVAQIGGQGIQGGIPFLKLRNPPFRVVGIGPQKHAPTAQLFKNPSDPRTADYLTGRFG